MVADSSNLIRLTKAKVKPAGKMLTRAFQDDPAFAYIAPDAFKRRDKLPRMFECFIRYGALYGEVYATSPNLEGVVIWLPSEKAEMTLWRMIRIGAISLYFTVGRKIVSRAFSYLDYAFELHKRHAPFPHWHLALIGVDPAFHGRGYASALIKPVLARIDQEHLPCYLETNNEENVPIYEHFGFKVVEVDKIPGSDVNHWAMLRESKSS